MDQIRFLFFNNPLQFRGAHLLHRQEGNILFRQHLADNITVGATVDHFHIIPEGFDDLAHDFFRTGINSGIEHMHHFHGLPLLSFSY